MSDLTPDQISFLHATAQILHANGQQSDETIAAIRRLSRHLGAEMRVLPDWNGLTLTDRSATFRPAVFVAATPSGVAMNRVVAVGHVVEDAISMRLPAEAGLDRIRKASSLPPPPDALFALACASGAAALSITFGVAHPASIALIFGSAGAGGFLRRIAGRHGANAFAQAFLAAVVAGFVGACAVRYGISSELRLIAVCPCMILVPGPHLLNATFDLLGARIPLGASRLLFAVMVLASISAGLLIGFAGWGVTLPASPVGRAVSLLPVMLAAGVAAASYSMFFALPWRLMGWPIATAMIVDAARWMAMTSFHAGPVAGAGLAGLLAGVLLVPVARRRHIPFAGIGFASIVSLMPGVLVFRAMGGLFALQTAASDAFRPLIEGMIADGITAVLVIAAMTVGVVIPKHMLDSVGRRRGIGRPT